MFSDEQIKIAETFLGTAVTSGMLDNQVYLEMIDKIKREEEVFLPYSNVEDRLGISRMKPYSSPVQLKQNLPHANSMIMFTQSYHV